MENRAIGLVGGYLVVYAGARSEDDPRLGPYELVPATGDLLDLLQTGKHVQKSRKRSGYLVAWNPDPAQASAALPALTMWSGTDGEARRQVLSDVRELADTARQGLPLNASALRGKLRHLSPDDRRRLVGMLREGRVSPEGMVRVLEAASEVADSADSMEGSADEQALIDAFLGPSGYLDLSSEGALAVMSLASAPGGDAQIQVAEAENDPAHQASQGGAGTPGIPAIPASDMALLLSTGLGLKRALPWPQVKSSLVRAAVSGASDPAQAVSEELGVPSLRTSMAPIRRFVETARSMGLSSADVSTTLDVATAARDVGEAIAAISEKDATTRRARWSAAGVPQRMLQPLERVRSNTIQHAARLSPSGAPEHKTHERAEEMLSALLTEGVTISDELDKVPIETYSAHPFSEGASDKPLPEHEATTADGTVRQPLVEPVVPTSPRSTNTTPEETAESGDANET
jgi:hypothetical protein